MAYEAPAEGEQDFEAGDQAGHMGGFFEESDDESEMDFTGGDEEPEPFTEFEQFESYETSDELIHDLTKAAEDDRKALEEKIRQGGRPPRGGIPEADEYVMQKIDLFLQY